jgi:hypothetical protein
MVSGKRLDRSGSVFDDIKIRNIVGDMLMVKDPSELFRAEPVWLL